jgi:hypothetical protein
MNHFRRASALGFVAVLTNCSLVPLPSLIQLSRINAETTDLAALRVAVRLPAALTPRPSGVNMDVLATVSGEADHKTTFLLTEMREAADLSSLVDAVRPGFSIHAYRLAPSEVERFVLMRAALFKKRHEGRRVSLRIGVATKEFCLVGPLPPGPLLSTSYLSTSETRGYVVVANDFDLGKVPAVATELSKLGPC